MKTKTINLQGKEYAQVQDRLIEFRTANPNGVITTTPDFHEDGQVMFKAHIVRDKSDTNSAEATGHALGMNKGVKAFEKLETIAVGRALALLGYASSGEIASSEEMTDFLDYQQTKKAEMILEATEKLQDCKTLEELKTAWADLSVEAKAELNHIKEDLKIRLAPAKVRKPKMTIEKEPEQHEN